MGICLLSTLFVPKSCANVFLSFVVKDIDVLFKHKSLILETISDFTLLERGLNAVDHGTEKVTEVRNKENILKLCSLYQSVCFYLHTINVYYYI